MTRRRRGAADWVVRAAAWIVPDDVRHDWRREWEAELAWCRQAGRRRGDIARRAFGAWRHAWWLRRDRWRGPVMGRDLRQAARALAARPMFTLVAVLSLALGIGANVAIFTVINAVLLRPLPFAAPDRLVQFVNGDGVATLSGPEVVDVVRDTSALEAVGAYAFADGNVTGGRGDAERVRIARVSAGFFTALAPRFAHGRPFAPDEDRPGAPDVVVISEALARRYFGDEAAAGGAPIRVNGVNRVVVGVVAAGFDFPTAAVHVWTPLALDPANPGERRNHTYRVVGRLAAAASVEAAGAEIDAMQRTWSQTDPAIYDPARPFVTGVTPIAERILGPTRPYLIAMAGAAIAVLLIACVNVASLLLAHGESRRRDLAIAAAMGATRRRLALQSMAESVWLAGAGGMAGLAIAAPAQAALLAMAPASLPRLATIGPDLSVLAFAGALSALTAVACGVVPLVRVVAAARTTLLPGGGRGTAAGGGRATRRWHGALIVAEVAMAMLLLSCAGVFARGLRDLQRVELGYDPDAVVTARLALPRGEYSETRAADAVATIVERLSAIGGVTHASAMAWSPVVEGGGMWSVMSDRVTPETNAAAPLAAPQQVAGDFFAALRIPLRRGRTFEPSDRAGAALVAVVNESFARMLWADDDPIGRRFRMFSPTARWVTVVGLVADTRVDGLTDAMPPVMYFPHAQARESAYFTALGVTVALRHERGRAPAAAEIRRVVNAIDRDVPVAEVAGLRDVIGGAVARDRFTTAIVATFAGLAAVLAGVGLYGVMSYAVAQRRREIGLRMALGASRAVVVAAVFRRGWLLTMAGLAIGVGAAAGAGRLIATFMTGVRPLDPAALAAAGLALAAVAGLALLLPARRATRINPLDCLRQG